jgi:sporulation protein YlmC with PRC-barrel domain
MEDLTGLLARKAATHFRSTDQEAIEVTQDLVKAILKDYVIIKTEKNEVDT